MQARDWSAHPQRVSAAPLRTGSTATELVSTRKFQGEYLMKQFVLWMAIVGLATTGCAQNRVLGPHARRGGTDFQIAQSRLTPGGNVRNVRPDFRTARNETDASRRENFSEDDVELAMYGGRCRGCNTCDNSCGSGCEDPCGGDCAIGGGPDEYCGSDDCCGGGCDSGYADGCSGDASCRSGSGCSSCGGRGCGLCQRLVGRVASGFCPHAGGYPEAYNYNPSPPTGQVAYPYYTVRGPRDFLRNNPPSIGPY